MYSVEELQANIKAIADNVPDRFKTTIGGNMHWIITQAFVLHFQPLIEALEMRIKELENEEWRIQVPERDTETNIKAPRRRKE